jgi:hypothetical protein
MSKFIPFLFHPPFFISPSYRCELIEPVRSISLNPPRFTYTGGLDAYTGAAMAAAGEVSRKTCLCAIAHLSLRVKSSHQFRVISTCTHVAFVLEGIAASTTKGKRGRAPRSGWGAACISPFSTAIVTTQCTAKLLCPCQIVVHVKSFLPPAA